MWFIFTYENPSCQNEISFSHYATYADNSQVAIRRLVDYVRQIFNSTLQDHQYKYSILDISDQEDGKVHWLSHIMMNGDFSTRNEPMNFDE